MAAKLPEWMPFHMKMKNQQLDDPRVRNLYRDLTKASGYMPPAVIRLGLLHGSVSDGLHGPAAARLRGLAVLQRCCTNNGNVHLHAQSALVDLARQQREGANVPLGMCTRQPAADRLSRPHWVMSPDHAADPSDGWAGKPNRASAQMAIRAQAEHHAA